MSRPSRRAEERGKTGKTRRRRGGGGGWVESRREQCKGWSEVFDCELDVHVHLDQLDEDVLLVECPAPPCLCLGSADAAARAAARLTDRHAHPPSAPACVPHKYPDKRATTSPANTQTHILQIRAAPHTTFYSDRFPSGLPASCKMRTILAKVLLLAHISSNSICTVCAKT